MVGLAGGRVDSFRVMVLRLVDALYHHARDAAMAEARSRSREQEEPVAQGDGVAGLEVGMGWGGGGGGGGSWGRRGQFLLFYFLFFISVLQTNYCNSMASYVYHVCYKSWEENDHFRGALLLPCELSQRTNMYVHI